MVPVLWGGRRAGIPPGLSSVCAPQVRRSSRVLGQPLSAAALSSPEARPEQVTCLGWGSVFWGVTVSPRGETEAQEGLG